MSDVNISQVSSEDSDSESYDLNNDDISMISVKERNLGYRKLKCESLWKRKSMKIKKDRGESYKTKKGTLIDAKKFKAIRGCCLKNCYRNVPNTDQAKFFESFWNLGNKDDQDKIVIHSLVPCTPKRRVENSKYKKRVTSWKYKLTIGCQSYDICRNFFLGLLQISAKRVRVVQQKLNEGQISIADMRGKHENRPHKIENEVWKMIDEHWSSIPSSQSHYSLNKTKKLYFDNPNLTVKTLYELFKEHFCEKTGQLLKMKYSTYHRYFRTNSMYAFRQPKSDVCDFCTQCKIALQANPNDSCKGKYDLHLKKYEKYKELKNKYLTSCKTDDALLVLEFDFAQNRPLPKLVVNSQFYKRLLWMYIFNIHTHNDDSSAFYWYLESEGEKNCDSVCSLLYDYISKKITPSTKKIVLFSDATGAQNKSVKVTKFLVWLSKMLDVEIEHIYPVRGHSYCVCDRNFGIYSPKMKKMETIQTSDEYVKVLRECRENPTPFDVIHARDILKNWTAMLSSLMFKKPTTKKAEWKIQQYGIIKYMRGVVIAHFGYSEVSIPFRLFKQQTHLFTAELDSKLPVVRVNEKKLEDVRALMPFLDQNGRTWFQKNVFLEEM